MEGTVVGGDVVAGMEDIGIKLGVDVVDVVIVMVAGTLVMAEVGESGVVRVPWDWARDRRRTPGFEMPGVGVDSVVAVPLNPSPTHHLPNIVRANDLGSACTDFVI